MYHFVNGFPAAWVTQKPCCGSPSLPLVLGCSKGGTAALLMWLDYRVGQPECLNGVGWPYQQAGQPGHVGLDGFDNPAVALSQLGCHGGFCKDDGCTWDLRQNAGLWASFDLSDSEVMPNTAVTQPHLPPYQWRRSFGPYHSAKKQKSKISVVHGLAVLKGHPECLKCGKILWRPELRPGPHWGSLQRCPRPPSWWKGGWLPLPKNPSPALSHSGLQP